MIKPTRKPSLWIRVLVQAILVGYFGILTAIAIVFTPFWLTFFLVVLGPRIAWRRTIGIWRAYLGDVIDHWRSCTAIANGTRSRCTPSAG